MIRSFIKRRFPALFAQAVKVKQWLVTYPIRRQAARFHRTQPGISVCYLTEEFPQAPRGRRDYVYGGAVKMVYLAEAYPHSFPGANILYTVSSVGHTLRSQIVAGARRRRLKIVVNQNGVAYPAWHGAGWEGINRILKESLDLADVILYQSRFCQAGAERYLSPPPVPCEVLYNPVDLELFTPIPPAERPGKLTLLLGGNQYERYRFELAVRTLEAVRKHDPEARLIVTGKLWDPPDEAAIQAKKLLQDLGLTEQVTFSGPYTQKQAPQVFAQAHILLHTKYNDPSPNLVTEAMASGLPVVYIASGGVPELVGEAGVGVEVEPSWERINLPEPEALAKGVLTVMDQYKEYTRLARERAGQFSLGAYLTRHREIFTKVLEQ